MRTGTTDPRLLYARSRRPGRDAHAYALLIRTHCARYVTGKIYSSQENLNIAIMFPNSSLEYLSISDFPPTKVTLPEQKFVDCPLVVWVSHIKLLE